MPKDFLPPNIKHITLLVDGSHLANRVFFVESFSTSKGHPTTILFGVLDNIRKFVRRLWERNGPDCTCDVYILWDVSGSFLRKKIFPEYKANRRKKAEEGTIEEQEEQRNKYEQIAETISVYKQLNLKSIGFTGVEGDDLIGILSRLFAVDGRHVVILSSDRDMLQLINEYVHVYRPIEDQYFDEENFNEKFGYSPPTHIFIKALVGKGADNVPGVEGVGASTAIKWLQKYGSIDGLLENFDKLTPAKQSSILSLAAWRAPYYPEKIKSDLDLAKEQLMINVAVSRIVTDINEPLEVDRMLLIEAIEKVVGGSRDLDSKTFVRIMNQYELSSIARQTNEFLEIFELNLV